MSGEQAVIKHQLLNEFAAQDVHVLLNRVPLRTIRITRKTSKRLVAADTQRKVLVAIDSLETETEDSLPVKTVAQEIPGTHWKTIQLAVASMSIEGLLWQKAKGPFHFARGVSWDKIRDLLNPKNYEDGIPETYHTAFDRAAETQQNLLRRHKLASTQPIVDNLCLRALEHRGKLIGSETQREVLRIIASFEPHPCPLTMQQFAERVARVGHLSPRTIRRTIESLVDKNFVLHDDNVYSRRQANRFVRWDQLQALIPARNTWRAAQRTSANLLEHVQAGKKRVLALHGTATQALAKAVIPSASSGAVIVSPEVQRAILALVGTYDRGCRLTCKELAEATKVSQRTVNHCMAALVNQQLIIEHAIGNSRLRLLCWEALEKLIPPAEPLEPHETSDGQIVVSSWLPIVDDNSKNSPKSLRSVFRKYIEPGMIKRSRAKDTIAEILRALDAWELHWPPEMHCVKKIRPRHLEAFQDSLLKRRLSNATVNNYLRSIQRVLIAANRHGLIRRRPAVMKLPTKASPKHYLRFQDLEAIWEACEQAAWPVIPGLTTAAWWRCAITLYWIYGFRTQELVSFRPDRSPLNWAAISLAEDTPNPEGCATNALGWLTYTPQKQKWAKPTPLFLPLTRHSRRAIELLPRDHQDAHGRLFPWPQSSRDFYGTWKAIQATAGIATKSGGHFQTKAFRRSAATFLERHHRGLGAAVIGWADREVSSVMAKHYAVSELILVEQLKSYQVPDCFDSL